MSETDNIFKKIAKNIVGLINRANLYIANLILINILCVFAVYKVFSAGRPKAAIAIALIDIIIVAINIIILHIKKYSENKERLERKWFVIMYWNISDIHQ